MLSAKVHPPKNSLLNSVMHSNPRHQPIKIVYSFNIKSSF